MKKFKSKITIMLAAALMVSAPLNVIKTVNAEDTNTSCYKNVICKGILYDSVDTQYQSFVKEGVDKFKLDQKVVDDIWTKVLDSVRSYVMSKDTELYNYSSSKSTEEAMSKMNRISNLRDLISNTLSSELNKELQKKYESNTWFDDSKFDSTNINTLINSYFEKFNKSLESVSNVVDLKKIENNTPRYFMTTNFLKLLMLDIKDGKVNASEKYLNSMKEIISKTNFTLTESNKTLNQKIVSKLEELLNSVKTKVEHKLDINEFKTIINSIKSIITDKSLFATGTVFFVEDHNNTPSQGTSLATYIENFNDKKKLFTDVSKDSLLEKFPKMVEDFKNDSRKPIELNETLIKEFSNLSPEWDKALGISKFFVNEYKWGSKILQDIYNEIASKYDSKIKSEQENWVYGNTYGVKPVTNHAVKTAVTKNPVKKPVVKKANTQTTSSVKITPLLKSKMIGDTSSISQPTQIDTTEVSENSSSDINKLTSDNSNLVEPKSGKIKTIDTNKKMSIIKDPVEGSKIKKITPTVTKSIEFNDDLAQVSNNLTPYLVAVSALGTIGFLLIAGFRSKRRKNNSNTVNV